MTEVGCVDLLMDFAALADRLGDLLADPSCVPAEDRVVDEFLLAAGLHQVVDDYLHRDVYALAKAAKHLPSVLGARVGGGAAGVARSLRAGVLRNRAAQRREQRVLRWREELAPLVLQLAAALVNGQDVTGGGLRLTLGELLVSVTELPGDLGRSVVRLPQCFRSFDVRPADCERLVHAFADRWPDRRQPLLVVGLRSAGSWLGPLHAAALLEVGYKSVEAMTMRPGQDWLGHEQVRLAHALRAGALVLLVDEPPRSGAQLAIAAGQLERVGFARDRLAMLTQLFEPVDSVPRRLRGYQHVLLPWQDWSIHEHLAPEAVRGTLATLLVGRTVAEASGSGSVRVAAVEEVERVDEPPSDAQRRRGHVSAVFRAVVLDGSAARHEQYVRAEGAGLGYLGRPALTIAERLQEFVPEVYGVRDGLLYRAWLPDHWCLASDQRGVQDADASGVAAYVVRRSSALAAGEDMSSRLEGRDATWELVADLLGDAFGGAKQLVRPLVRQASRRLLETEVPCIVDGSMMLDHWFAPRTQADQPQRLLKVDFSDRAFSNEDAYCYDPFFDLASAAASSRSTDPAADGFAAAVRSAYEQQTGRPVPEARWLLYQLLHQERTGRQKLREALAAHQLDAAASQGLARRCVELDRLSSRVCQDYFHALFFADVEVPLSGRLCAIDLDWVLETRWRSFPTTSPSGALALRALTRHGYRPVLATGRSLSEVRERCLAYRLAGGVAEYGSITYDQVADHVTVLLSRDEIDVLHDLKAVLSAIPGVHLNPFHEGSIRAHRVTADARLTGLDALTIEDALVRSGTGDNVRVVVADSQTDFVPARVNKARGLRSLAADLAAGSSADPSIALAVGDSFEDLPMLELARLAVVPANADAELRHRCEGTAVERSNRPCQAGLLDAVSRLLGHDPRHCGRCRTRARPEPDEELLLTILAALDGGARKKVEQGALLAARLAVSSQVPGRGCHRALS